MSKTDSNGITNIPVTVIRSKTNDGEFAKQTFYILRKEGTDSALIVRKLVLTDNPQMYYNDGCKFLRHYKGKVLVLKTFGIKLKTLWKLVSALNSMSS